MRRDPPVLGATLLCTRSGGPHTARHRSPSASLCLHEARVPWYDEKLAPERKGGPPLHCYCTTSQPISKDACAAKVESTVHLRFAGHDSPTSLSLLGLAREVKRAVRALAKARPLLGAAACLYAHHYDCLSLFLHLRLRAAATSSPCDTTVSISLPPRHALTGYACAPPANILRGW